MCYPHCYDPLLPSARCVVLSEHYNENFKCTTHRVVVPYVSEKQNRLSDADFKINRCHDGAPHTAHTEFHIHRPDRAPHVRTHRPDRAPHIYIYSVLKVLLPRVCWSVAHDGPGVKPQCGPGVKTTVWSGGQTTVWSIPSVFPSMLRMF